MNQITIFQDKTFRIRMHLNYIHDSKQNVVFKKKKYHLNYFFLRNRSKNSKKNLVYLKNDEYEELCKEIPKYFFLNITLKRKTDFLGNCTENSVKHIMDSQVLQLLLFSSYFFENNLDKDLIVRSNKNAQRFKKQTRMFLGDIGNNKVIFEIDHNEQKYISKKIKINEVCINKKIILTCKKTKENLFLSMNITLYGNTYNTKVISLSNRYTIINNTNRILYIQEINKEFKIMKNENKLVMKNPKALEKNEEASSTLPIPLHPNSHTIKESTLTNKGMMGDIGTVQVKVVKNVTELQMDVPKSYTTIEVDSKMKEETKKKGIEENKKSMKEKRENTVTKIGAGTGTGITDNRTLSKIPPDISSHPLETQPPQELNIICVQPYESYYYHPISRNKCFLKFSYCDFNEYMNEEQPPSPQEHQPSKDTSTVVDSVEPKEQGVLNVIKDHLKKKSLKGKGVSSEEEEEVQGIARREEFFNLYYTCPLEIERLGNFKIYHKIRNKTEKKKKIKKPKEPLKNYNKQDLQETITQSVIAIKDICKKTSSSIHSSEEIDVNTTTNNNNDTILCIKEKESDKEPNKEDGYNNGTILVDKVSSEECNVNSGINSTEGNGNEKNEIDNEIIVPVESTLKKKSSKEKGERATGSFSGDDGCLNFVIELEKETDNKEYDKISTEKEKEKERNNENSKKEYIKKKDSSKHFVIPVEAQRINSVESGDSGMTNNENILHVQKSRLYASQKEQLSKKLEDKENESEKERNQNEQVNEGNKSRSSNSSTCSNEKEIYYDEYKEESIITIINITMNRNTNIEINVSMENNPDTIVYNKTNYPLIYYQRKTKKKIINTLKPFEKEIFGWSSISKPKIIKCFLVFKEDQIFIFTCNLNIVKKHNSIVLNDEKSIDVVTKIENGKRVFCIEEVVDTKEMNGKNDLSQFDSTGEVRRRSYRNYKALQELNLYKTYKTRRMKKLYTVKLNGNDRTHRFYGMNRFNETNKKNDMTLTNKKNFSVIYLKKKKKMLKKKNKTSRLKSLFVSKNSCNSEERKEKAAVDIEEDDDNEKIDQIEKKKKRKIRRKGKKRINNSRSNFSNIDEKNEKLEIEINQNKVQRLNCELLIKKKTIIARGKKFSKNIKNKLLNDLYVGSDRNSLNNDTGGVTTPDSNIHMLMDYEKEMKRDAYMNTEESKKEYDWNNIKIRNEFKLQKEDVNLDKTQLMDHSNMMCVYNNSEKIQPMQCNKKYEKTNDLYFIENNSEEMSKGKISEYIFTHIKANKKRLGKIAKIYPKFMKKNNRNADMNLFLKNYISEQEKQNISSLQDGEENERKVNKYDDDDDDDDHNEYTEESVSKGEESNMESEEEDEDEDEEEENHFMESDSDADDNDDDNDIHSWNNIRKKKKKLLKNKKKVQKEKDKFINYYEKKEKKKSQVKMVTNVHLVLYGMKINLFESSSDYVMSLEVNDLIFRKEYIENMDYYSVDIRVKNVLCFTIYKYLVVHTLLYPNNDMSMKNNDLRILMNELQKKRDQMLDKKYDEESYSSTTSLFLHNQKENEEDMDRNSEFLICNFQYVHKYETLLFKYFLLSIKPLVINADINSITILFYFYKTFYNFDKKKINKEEEGGEGNESERDPNRLYSSVNTSSNPFCITNGKEGMMTHRNIDSCEEGFISFSRNNSYCRAHQNNNNKSPLDLCESTECVSSRIQKRPDEMKRSLTEYSSYEVSKSRGGEGISIEKEIEESRKNKMKKENLEKNELSKYVYIQYISIDKINVLFNFKSEYKKELSNHANDIFYKKYISIYNKLGDISNCNIYLKSLCNIHIFTNSTLLMDFLQNYYYNQTIVNISNVLISFNIIGSPTSLFAHIKKAFNEFFTIINEESAKDKNYFLRKKRRMLGDHGKNCKKEEYINLLNESNLNTGNEEDKEEEEGISKNWLVQMFNDFNYNANSNNADWDQQQKSYSIFKQRKKKKKEEGGGRTRGGIQENCLYGQDTMRKDKKARNKREAKENRSNNSDSEYCDDKEFVDNYDHGKNQRQQLQQKQYRYGYSKESKEKKKEHYLNANDFNSVDNDDMMNNNSLENSAHVEKRKTEMGNLVNDENESINSLVYNNEKDLMLLNASHGMNENEHRRKNTSMQTTESQINRSPSTFLYFLPSFFTYISYSFKKFGRINIGLFVLSIRLILSLLFSISLILQSLINMIEKIKIHGNTNMESAYVLYTKKCKRKKINIFNDTEEYNHFNVSKLLYYYVSIYGNIIKFVYSNMLSKIEKNKKDAVLENANYLEKIKFELKKRRRYTFFINSVGNVFNIFGIFLFGHFVFILLCFLSLNNLFQNMLKYMINLVYCQNAKKYLNILNMNNTNHINIVSYIKINQIVNKYIYFNEPFRYFSSYQNIIYPHLFNKKYFFVCTKHLLFYIHDNKILFLFRKTDLKKVDIMVQTMNHSFTLNSYYKRRKTYFGRMNASRNTVSNCMTNLDSTYTGEENPSLCSSSFFKSNVSQEEIEERNIIYYLNSDIALNKRNEIIDIHDRNFNYVLCLVITIKNNMNIVENAYYNPKKFFKSFLKVQKSFNNIYLPLHRNMKGEGRGNSEKNLKKHKQISKKDSFSSSIIQRFYYTIFYFFKKLTRKFILKPLRKISVMNNHRSQRLYVEDREESKHKMKNKMKMRMKLNNRQNFKKHLPRTITFKINFEEFQSCMNIFDCLCRFIYENN